MPTNLFVFGSIAAYVGLAILMAGTTLLYAKSLSEKANQSNGHDQR